MRTVPLAIGLVLTLLSSTSCKRDVDGDATKITVGSKDDATKAVIDEGYRFELGWPGPGWKLMHPRDAAKLVPDAVAAAVHADAVFAAVIVESAPGVALEAYADLLVDKLPLVDKKIERREQLRFAGENAERFTITGKLDGVAFRYIEIAFVHQGYGYQLLGWATQGDLSPGGRELQPLFDHFKLLPGKVSGRPSGPVVTTAQGVGWHVDHGVFESGVTGLRAKAREPWRLLVGAGLEQTNADAEVGIAHSDPEVFTVLIAERAPPPGPGRVAFIAKLRAKLEGVGGKPWTGTFAGKELAFTRITSTGPMAFEYLHGVHVEGDQLVQVLTWYLANDRERASKIVQEGLDAFDFMPPSDAAMLAAKLATGRDSQAAVGTGFALRGGTYRSFANGWRWKRPPAIWRISTGEKARAVMPEAELVIFEPAKNLYGVVVSERTTLAADAFHASVVDATPGQKLPTQPIQLVEPALVSGADVEEDGASIRYRMYTMVKDGRGLKLMFWGTRGDVERYVGELDAAARGFAFDALPATETHAGAYLDRRFGFGVDVPARWSFVDQSPRGSTAIQTFATWTHGPSLMGVLALEQPVTDGDWFLDFVEQSIRDQMGPLVVGQARRSDATLGGQPARRLSWPELDAYVLARDGYIYGFIATADAPTSQAFRFVD